jgi:hypothetical protein
MELNEFANIMRKYSNPTDYLASRGFGNRWTQTSGAAYLRDPGYGRQLSPVTVSNVFDEVSKNQGRNPGTIPYVTAGIRKDYSRAWDGDMSFPTANAFAKKMSKRYEEMSQTKGQPSQAAQPPRKMTRREKKKAELAAQEQEANRRQAIDQDIRQKGLSVGYGGEPSQYDYTGQYEFQVGNAQRAIERRQMDDAFTAMDERLDREFDVTDTGLRPKPIPQEQSPPISGLRPPYDPSDREMTPEEMKSAEEQEQQARAPGGPLYNPYGYEELLERAKTLPPKTQEEAKKQRKMEAKLRVDRTRREAQSGSPSEPPSRPSTVLEGSRSARDQMAEALEPAGRVSQVTTTTGSGGQSTYRERTSNRPRTSAYELRLQSRIAQELNAKNM